VSDFQDRSVFVSGGNSGIGAAAALAFGRAGGRVAVVGRRRQANEEVAAQVRDAGGQAIAVQADVTDEQQVRSAVRATVEAFGSLDIAINNAGTWTPAPFAEITPAAWTSELDANLTSVYLSMRHQLPVMTEQGSGVIINNASVLGLVGTAGLSAYVAAKHGVIGLTRATALEYAGTPIRINAIAPAGVDTPHYRATLGADPGSAAAFRGMHPVGRLATAEEVAGLLLYLASPTATFFTGAAVAMDGAWSAQ
jgi:NAD(P)-dependent dehydrogenase (short-subunit alcohol dehydrogenase family)